MNSSFKVVNLLSKIAAAIEGITVSAGTFTNYKTNDIKESGTITYFGKSEPDSGAWLIQKLNEVDGTTVDMTYANLSNNGTVTTYDDAWTTRASLTYENIEDLTF